ncbi:zinc finger and BTB domain-containing protein 6-like isoform X1 [Schistocerca americana]|uniref:zinc finger and BTB domain-containing protein 6-like isoform X1 n=1 Tax=Schistocerca americana TaxID=7009 RepID=UPI001F4FE63F|nr:zinc finger and BTB domain-containing protein 6-like isoform X1 [Schistocerca americana]XP_046995856.1 zinc finger and BTB domain-containing protein 6-like isoform X1 [Schistocerca americana]
MVNLKAIECKFIIICLANKNFIMQMCNVTPFFSNFAGMYSPEVGRKFVKSCGVGNLTRSLHMPETRLYACDDGSTPDMLSCIASSERPFSQKFTCDQCEYLSGGAVVHDFSGQLLAGCPRCGRQYPSKRSLVRHVRYVCGKEPQLQCPYCPHRSKFASNLNQHILAIHPGRSLTQWKFPRSKPVHFML